MLYPYTALAVHVCSPHVCTTISFSVLTLAGLIGFGASSTLCQYFNPQGFLVDQKIGLFLTDQKIGHFLKC
jgi:hypothetical protein